MQDAASIEQALYDTLSSDVDLITLLGGMHLYDAPDRNAAFPYITLSIDESQDWSTGTEEGEQHRLQIHVWSGAHQRTLNHALLRHVSLRLKTSPPEPDQCQIINMHQTTMVMRADRKNQLFQGILRYRLVTEPKSQ